MRAVLAALVLSAIATPALAADVVAVPALDFNDTSGEPAGGADHEALLDGFAERLRADLTASGRVEAVPPACDGPCSPARTPFASMAEASRAVGAERLLVGSVHKISTLIGTVKLTMIDLPGDRVVCTRTLTYRGDTEEAWTRAARFAAEDVLANCLP